MGDMVEVAFNEVIPIEGLEVLLPTRAKTYKCKHPHCKKPVEMIGPTWYHLDGSRNCKQTSSEPEED